MDAYHWWNVRTYQQQIWTPCSHSCMLTLKVFVWICISPLKNPIKPITSAPFRPSTTKNYRGSGACCFKGDGVVPHLGWKMWSLTPWKTHGKLFANFNMLNYHGFELANQGKTKKHAKNMAKFGRLSFLVAQLFSKLMLVSGRWNGWRRQPFSCWVGKGELSVKFQTGFSLHLVSEKTLNFINGWMELLSP